MGHKFFGWLFYKVCGWSKKVNVDIPDKGILCVAPHTSNWDFVWGQMFMRAERMKAGFLMKKEWFFWPLGPIFRSWGGVPVERNSKHSLTEQMTQKLKEADHLLLCVTPEGTRRRTARWKRGFYYMALNANVPILLFGIDYERKLVECSKVFIPTGDVENDMKEIKQYFAPFKGKYPEQFTTENE